MALRGEAPGECSVLESPPPPRAPGITTAPTKGTKGSPGSVSCGWAASLPSVDRSVGSIPPLQFRPWKRGSGAECCPSPAGLLGTSLPPVVSRAGVWGWGQAWCRRSACRGTGCLVPGLCPDSSVHPQPVGWVGWQMGLSTVQCLLTLPPSGGQGAGAPASPPVLGEETPGASSDLALRS